MKRCVILAAAPVEDYSIITSALFPDDYIICADGGALHAQKLGRTPDLAVGDFDSCRPEDINAEKKIFPREKDDTDFMLAAYEGLARGYRDFLAFGATGGSRTDHTFGAYAAAAYLAENGASVELRDEKCTIYALCGGKLELPESPGHISIFAWGGSAEGVTTTGTKYNLTDFTLRANYPLGISNEFTGGPVSVEVKKGVLLIFVTIDN